MFLSKKILVYSSIAVVLFISGCATAPISLTPETTTKIKNVAIVTSLERKELQVLDHTEVWEKPSPLAMQFALIGALVDAASNAIEAKIKINKSLGGAPDLLKMEVGDLPVKDILDEYLIQRFQKKYNIINQETLEGTSRLTENKNYSIDDYLSAGKQAGADVLVKIYFVYGLAAYAAEPASAAIDANYYVYDLSNNNILLQRKISSEGYYKNGHVVEEFAANNAELFKSDINEAANGLSLIIASSFGIDVDEIKNKNVIEKIPVGFVTCKKPYLLEQDCSYFSGATRTVEFDGHKLRIAGSNDGRILMVTEDSPILHGVTDGLTLGFSDTRSDANIECFEVVKVKLLSSNINIIRTIKIVDGYGRIDGYLLELDSDGYSLLKEYSI